MSRITVPTVFITKQHLNIKTNLVNNHLVVQNEQQFCTKTIKKQQGLTQTVKV